MQIRLVMSAGPSDCPFSSCRRYMKHKRDDGAEKQDEETVDVTPIMICVFVVMCCSMLVLLYFFYDRLGTTDTRVHVTALNKHNYDKFWGKGSLVRSGVTKRLIVLSILFAHCLLLLWRWLPSKSQG